MLHKPVCLSSTCLPRAASAWLRNCESGGQSHGDNAGGWLRPERGGCGARLRQARRRVVGLQPHLELTDFARDQHGIRPDGEQLVGDDGHMAWRHVLGHVDGGADVSSLR